MELIQELQQKDRELSASIRQLRISGTAKAEAEKEYKIKLREEALKLRAEKGMRIIENQIEREWGQANRT